MVHWPPTEKSWLHFRPPPVDFCGSRLAIGAASERARALAMPAGTRAQALHTRANSSGVAPASPQAAYRALLERAGSREPADRGGVDGIGPRHIGLQILSHAWRRGGGTAARGVGTGLSVATDHDHRADHGWRTA